MAGSEHDRPDVKPSEQAGGTSPENPSPDRA